MKKTKIKTEKKGTPLACNYKPAASIGGSGVFGLLTASASVSVAWTNACGLKGSREWIGGGGFLVLMRNKIANII